MPVPGGVGVAEAGLTYGLAMRWLRKRAYV
jgi:uncharacterized membrane protein YbhN (UPF0104 family)